MTDWFTKDDDSYRDWLVAHPDGYVLNTTAPPTRSYLKVHRARCRTINRPAGGRRWTWQYSKVCARRVSELAQWARERTGGELTFCSLCGAGP